jgi:diguanylate cyclase (GGDEF)-like protein/PAS domain S-box-containing protein
MPAPKLTPHLRLHLAEWLGLWVMLLALGGFISYSEYLNYRQVDTSERSRLASQALVIEKNLAAQLFSADRALQALCKELAGKPSKYVGASTMDERLKLISDTLTGISTVLITNANGKIIHSNVASLVGFDTSGRDYFQKALKQRRQDLLFVSAPFTNALGKTSISLVREITGAYGEFGGVVLAALDPAFFGDLLDSVRCTPDTATSLVHGDGKLFVYAPANAMRVGKDLAVPGSFFTQHKASGRPTNLFAGVTYLTGDARMIAFQTVQPPELTMDKALVVTASRDASAIHADWLRQATQMAWMYAGLCLLVCAAMCLYQQRRRAFQRLTHAKERALRASDARLRSFFEATPDALLISDENGTITMANQQVEALLGYSMEELAGKSIEKLVPMRSRGGHPKLRGGFAATPTARRMSAGMAVKALRKNGSECDVEVSLSRIETDDGQFFASALRDITERLHAKASLLASETRLRTIIQNEPDCIKLVDADGRLLDMNPAGLAMIEVDRLEQVIGQAAINFVAPEYRIAFADMHRRVIAGESVELTFKVIGRKGGTRWLETRAVPMQDRGLPAHLAVTRDVTERKLAEQKINTLAFYDQLTGLPNRTLLADRLKQTLTASSRSGICGALLFIDLDHFKTLNDTQGHDIGDMQLKQVAARLTTCVREGDTVARVGGDEFVVILAGMSKSEIEAATDTEIVATKILAALNQPYPLGDLSHSSSASIGATLFRGTRASIDDLMKQADMAMYRAKDAGRNALCFFDHSMETAVVKRVAMEKDLRLAVEGKQFVLHYQAQVEGAGGVTGAEVLVRWHHPQQGMVSPADFIPLAEETGVILALGHWVLETACSQLKKWARMPSMKHLTLAVNVSALQFAQCDFVEQVMAVVQRSGANPQRLKLELTESLLIGNVAEIIEKMESLKASGIGFSLDDFGTGYSSLAYLSRLPLDQLKIDKSFVNDVVTNPDDAAIARTIIALAHSLRLGVIAEGVETDAQRKFLASAGCHAYQGYFFGRPLPLDDFEAFVRNISLPTTAPAI